MNATATIRSFFAALLCGAAAIASAQEARREVNPDAKLHRFSTTVEKERPELDEETKRLIAAFRRDPSDASRASCRTESRGEGRAPSLGYNTVGFRVVREDRE